MKPPSNRAIVRTVLVLGLLVGTLDILAAILDFYINTGKNPSSIFKYISSAILGKEAFTGGTGIIIIGLFLHYGIAFLFTIFFVWLHVKKKKLLPGNRLLTGIVYGIFIWMVMNLIIVPLSGTPKLPFVPWKVLKAMLILICMIGLPLAFFTERFLGNNKENE
jgi:hypothetical protein